MRNVLVERLLYACLLVTFLGVIGFGYVAITATNNLQKQTARLDEQGETIKQQNEQIKKVQEGQGKTVSSIQNSILCVITFFGLVDRDSLVIVSLDPCTVTDTSNGQSRQLEVLPSEPEPS